MQSEATSQTSRTQGLSSTDYDRLFEYRLAPSRRDLSKTYKRQRVVKSKGTRGHADPTAYKAIRRVMYSTKTVGF